MSHPLGRGQDHILYDGAQNALLRVRKAPSSNDGANYMRTTVRVSDNTGGGVDTATLAGNTTLTLLGSARIQELDPDGSARDVTLPAEANCAGVDYWIVNKAGGAENLVVKSDAPATIITINQAETGYVYCDGTTWRGIVLSENAAAAQTLDQAYDAGATIDSAADTGSGVIIGDGTDTLIMYATGATATIETDTGTSLTIAPVGSGDLTLAPGGGDIVVTGDMNVSGTLISGTADAFQVDAAGAIICTGLTCSGAIYQTAIASAAAGDIALTIDAAGSGTITIGNTSTGMITIADDCTFSETLTMATDKKLQFRDSGQYIHSAAASTLTLVSAGGINATAAAASTWSVSGGALIVETASQNLTVRTTTSGTLAITSAGVLDLTGVGASTFAFSGGAFDLTVDSQNCTVQTSTSGTLALTSAAALTLTGVATTLTTTGAVIWTHSGGTFVVTSTSQDLSLITASSGDIAITSAAALGLTGVATTFTTTGAVVWTHSGGAFAVTSTSQALSLITATAGDITFTAADALNMTGAAASTWGFSGGAFALTVTGQACTISTASSGTLLISSAAALQLTGVATTLTTTGAVVWTHSGGTFVVTSTSQDLSLVTDTAGDIAITSAAALGLTGVATTFTTTGAVVWTHSGGAFGITSTSQNLSLITATAGDIAITSAAALTLTAPANTSITCASHVNATAKGNSTIVVAGAVGDGSFDVDVDGNFGVDSSNGRFYFRYGAAWHYCTQDA